MRIGRIRPVDIGHLHLFEQGLGAGFSFGAAHVAVALDHLPQLVATALGRVQAGHRLLEDHGDAVPAGDGGQGVAEVGAGPALAQTEDAATRQRRGLGQESQCRHAAQGFPRATFSDQRQGLTGRHGQVDVAQDGAACDVQADAVPAEGGFRACHAGPARVRWLRRAP